MSKMNNSSIASSCDLPQEEALIQLREIPDKNTRE